MLPYCQTRKESCILSGLSLRGMLLFYNIGYEEKCQASSRQHLLKQKSCLSAKLPAGLNSDILGRRPGVQGSYISFFSIVKDIGLDAAWFPLVCADLRRGQTILRSRKVVKAPPACAGLQREHAQDCSESNNSGGTTFWQTHVRPTLSGCILLGASFFCFGLMKYQHFLLC